MSCLKRFKHVLLPIIGLILSARALADVNVLVIGCSNNVSYVDSNYNWSTSQSFNATGVVTQLRSILQGANLGAVNVTFEDRTALPGYSAGRPGMLASWYYWPYPSGDKINNRWPNLRGEKGTQWDYIVLIPDPYEIEKTPGWYTFGVSTILNEVNKSTNVKKPEVVLLMTWPNNNSAAMLNQYKEVVYRTGNSGDIKVVPAGLAWQAAGSPTNPTTFPTADGSYLAAASIYSRLWGQSAATSTYSYNATLANTAHATVVENLNKVQYTGKYTGLNPFSMLGDKRRFVFHSHKGTSTETMLSGATRDAFASAGVLADELSYKGKYSSDTPEDDGMGWDMHNPMPIGFNIGRSGAPRSEEGKRYVTNSNYWQMAFGYCYQDADATLADLCEGMLFEDVAVALYQSSSGEMLAGAKSIPVRTLAVINAHEDPNYNQTSDGVHLTGLITQPSGVFISTLYSGRCPVDPLDPINQDAKRLGYEMAWQMSQLQVRAPGFRVVPSAHDKLTMDGGTNETMTVEFLYPPKSNVVVNLTTSNEAACMVYPRTLVFTPQNYNVKQKVQVSAMPGALANTALRFDFNTSSADEVFNGLYETIDYTLVPKGAEAPNIVVQDSRALTTPKNVPVSIDLQVLGATPDNTLLIGPNRGRVDWDGNAFIYVPDSNYTGTDFVGYAVYRSGVLTKGIVDITVTDTTALPTRVGVVANDPIAAESGQETGQWTITRTGDLSAPLPVNFTLTGMASAGVDYTLDKASPVTIPAGQSSVTITLTPVNDSVLNEDGETAQLMIAVGAGYTPFAGSPGIAIMDNDWSDLGAMIVLDRPANGVARIPAGVGMMLETTVNGLLEKQRGRTCSVQWSQVSGPGVATFASPNAEDSAVSFSTTTGTYVLRMLADDGVEQVTKDITVEVGATVAGGLWEGWRPGEASWLLPNPKERLLTDIAFQTETMGYLYKDYIGNGTNTIILSGRFFDADGIVSFTEDYKGNTLLKIDGQTLIDRIPPQLPSGEPDYYRVSTGTLHLTPGWHDIEIRVGSGVNVNGGANSTPGVGYDPDGGTNWQSFPSDARDGKLFRVDEGNIGPIISAGQDASGIVEGSLATVLATFSDDGAPVGPPVQLTWSQVGGPGHVTIQNPHAPSTGLVFDKAGVYTLRVEADDLGIKTFDEMQVTVVPNLSIPGQFEFTAMDFAQAEGDVLGTLNVQVTRRNGALGAASVNYGTADATATTADGDYCPVAGTLSWAHGESGPKTISIPVLGDVRFEADETVQITLSNPAGAGLGALHTATATLLDDDAPVYLVTYNGNGQDYGLPPAHAYKAHDVGLPVASNSGGLVRARHLFAGWNTKPDGTGTAYAPGDLCAVNADLTLYAQWDPVRVLLQEGFESPVVTGYQENTIPNTGKWIGATNGYQSNWRGLVNKDGGAFANPDPLNHQGYAIHYGNAGITTAEGVMELVQLGARYDVSFRVVRDGSDTVNTATYYQAELLAVPRGADRSSVINMPVGARLLATASGNAPADGSFQTVNFSFTPDAIANADAIGYDLTLRFKKPGVGFGAIIDDVQVSARLADALNVVTVTATDSAASEAGSDPAVWTIARTGDTSAALSIPISISGTASPADYTLNPSAWATIPAGQSSTTVTLTPADDALGEGPETATLVLGGGPGYLLKAAVSSISIADNDPVSQVYALIYQAGVGGGLTGSLEQHVTQGNSGTMVTAIPALGHVFQSWNDGNTNASRVDSPVADVTYTAYFTAAGYSITYSGNGSDGGAVPPAQTKLHGSDAVVASNGSMSKTGVYFTGWNTAANGSGQSYAPGSVYSTDANLTLYAQWSATPPACTLTYLAASGGSITGAASQTLASGNSSTLVSATPATGYQFVQWSDGNTNSSRTDIATGNATFVAYFTIRTYSVSYAGNGADGGVLPATQTKIHGVGLTLTPIDKSTILRSGFAFTGWNTQSDGSGVGYAPGGVYSGNAGITLYAQWESQIPVLFEEDFESPVVSGYAENTLPNNGKWIAASVGFGATKHGLINEDSGAFSNPDPDNNQGYAFRYGNAGITTAAGILRPVLAGDEITVTFDAVSDGGMAANNTNYELQVIAFGEGAARNDARSIPAGSDLLANLQGNVPADGIIRSYTLTVPIDPDVMSAALGKDLAIRFRNYSGAIIDNVRVTGIYVPIFHAVTYDGNGHAGGTVPVDQIRYATHDTVIVMGNSGSLTRNGYVFGGWNTAPDGTGDDYAPGQAFAISGPIRLYARWLRPEIAVKGNAVEITSGDQISSFADHTYFASPTTHTFTISNTGQVDLVLSGNPPVTLIGSSAFSVSRQPGAAILAPGASATFDITFAPSSSGAQSAIVSIANNDLDENPYIFVVAGNLPVVSVTATQASASEVGVDGKWTFSCSEPVGANLFVYFSISGTADENTDYLLNADSSLIMAGQSSDDVLLYPLADGLIEGSETVVLTITESANYVIATPSATIQIADAPTVVVVSPNGGEFWQVQGPVKIRWQSVDGGNVKIELWKAGALHSVIASSTPNDGSYDWTVPANLPVGSDYRVRVSLASDPAVLDSSNADFTVGNDPLADAVDCFNLKWTTSGNANWFRQTATKNDGVDAAESGNIADSQSSSIETTVVGPGTLTFWWKVSSEASYDTLGFTINDQEQAGVLPISGNVNWTQQTVSIPAGSQVLKWKYNKDHSVSSGSDAGWLDQVVWTPAAATLTYLANGATGGSVPTDGNAYVAGDAVTVLGNSGNLVRTGYTFSGWNTAANGSGTSYQAGSEFTISTSTTLYAKWTALPTYSVTYIANGATSGSVPAVQQKIQGITLNLATNSGNLVRTAYAFSGWNTAANGSGVDYATGATYGTDAALTLYAKWIALPTYTVSYDGNGNTGGTVPSDQTKIENVALTLASQGTLVRTGYLFTGWNTSADGSGTTYAQTGSYVANAAVTLYAQWVLSYTVTYDANGATGGTVPASQVKLHGVSLTLSANSGNLVKTGYAFACWNTAADGTGTNYWEASTYAGNADVTLYAKWVAGNSGTWTGTTGLWSDTANPGVWQNGIPANGADNTAYFTGVNITADQTITLDTNRTMGRIVFTDSTTSSNNLTISGSNVLTLSTTGSAPSVDVTQSARTLRIDSVIAGSQGFQKSGAGTLYPTAANTFTGGIDLSSGTIQVSDGSNANALGNASNILTFSGNGTLYNSNNLFTMAQGIQVNAGVTGTLSGAQGETTTVSGAVTGSGNLSITGASSGFVLNLNHTTNTISGTIWVGVNNYNTTLNANSLADGSAGSSLKMGSGSASASFTLGSTLPGALVWNNRQLELAGTTGSVTIANNASTAANSLTIQPDVLVSGTGNKTLTLGGSNAGNNKIAGNLSDAAGSVISVTKSGTGNWTLGGSGNAFTGTITLSSTTTSCGALAYASAAGSNPITFSQTSGSATLAYVGASPLTMSGLITASALTSGTITLDASGTTPAAAIQYSNPASFTSVATNNSARKLVLTGTNTGANVFNGVFTNNSGTGNAATLTKNGTGTWVLTNANAYTGATSVSAGKLFINGDQTAASGAVSVASGATLGGTGTIGGSATIADGGKLEFNLSTAAASHDSLVFATGKSLAFAGASELTITTSGGAAAGDYILLSAPGGITAPTLPSLNLPAGWIATVSVSGSNLVLKVSAVSTPYQGWSAGASFGTDSNHDGIANGVAWVLGAGNPSTNARTLLPTCDATGDPDFLIFTYRRIAVVASDPATSVAVQFGSDLSQWSTAVHDGNDVIITPTNDFYGAGIDKVEVKIRKTLVTGGSLFARLRVTQSP